MTENKMTIADRHQLVIARDTLRMSNEVVSIMGGMTKAEAVLVVLRLTGNFTIHSDDEHESALSAVDGLMDAPPDSDDEKTLEKLAIIVEAYEKEHYPIDPPDDPNQSWE